MADTPARVYRVGLIHYVAKGDAFINTGDIVDFKAGMERIGLREGVNVVYDERYGNRDMALTQRHADEMVAARLDVIVSFLTNANIALKNAMAQQKHSIPVVCWATDLKEAGLIESYRRPGGDFTGFTYEPYNQWTKVRLLKRAVPGLSRLAHFYNPTYSPAPAVLRDLQEAAEAMALEFRVYETLRLEDFEASVARIKADGCGAVVVGPHELFNRNGEHLGRLFLDAGLPAVGNQLSIMRAGGLASFNPPKKVGWPSMALVAERILQGEKPAEIAIDRSHKGPLTINLRSARALGLQLADALVEEADVLIE